MPTGVYKRIKPIWNKGKRYTLGRHCSEETKARIRATKIGDKNPMFGKHPSPETIKKKREALKGHIVANETRIKIGNTTKERWQDAEYRKEHTKHWDNPEFKNQWIKNTLKGLLVRPTSFEQKISDLCFKNNLPFIYTGDGGFIINYKNPDFVDEKDKILIEVFYSWFKIRDYGSVENYKEFCRNKYEPAGWKVIFIDETEIDTDDWERICLNKISNAMEVLNGKN